MHLYQSLDMSSSGKGVSLGEAAYFVAETKPVVGAVSPSLEEDSGRSFPCPKYDYNKPV